MVQTSSQLRPLCTQQQWQQQQWQQQQQQHDCVQADALPQGQLLSRGQQQLSASQVLQQQTAASLPDSDLPCHFYSPTACSQPQLLGKRHSCNPDPLPCMQAPTFPHARESWTGSLHSQAYNTSGAHYVEEEDGLPTSRVPPGLNRGSMTTRGRQADCPPPAFMRMSASTNTSPNLLPGRSHDGGCGAGSCAHQSLKRPRQYVGDAPCLGMSRMASAPLPSEPGQYFAPTQASIDVAIHRSPEHSHRDHLVCPPQPQPFQHLQQEDCMTLQTWSAHDRSCSHVGLHVGAGVDTLGLDSLLADAHGGAQLQQAPRHGGGWTRSAATAIELNVDPRGSAALLLQQQHMQQQQHRKQHPQYYRKQQQQQQQQSSLPDTTWAAEGNTPPPSGYWRLPDHEHQQIWMEAVVAAAQPGSEGPSQTPWQSQLHQPPADMQQPWVPQTWHDTPNMQAVSCTSCEVQPATLPPPKATPPPQRLYASVPQQQPEFIKDIWPAHPALHDGPSPSPPPFDLPPQWAQTPVDRTNQHSRSSDRTTYSFNEIKRRGPGKPVKARRTSNLATSATSSHQSMQPLKILDLSLPPPAQSAPQQLLPALPAVTLHSTVDWLPRISGAIGSGSGSDEAHGVNSMGDLVQAAAAPWNLTPFLHQREQS